MVLVHPNPPPGQGFNHFYSYHFGGDPMGMKTTEQISQTPSYWSAGAGGEDPSKKVRKPYTITKSRESWSEQEHEKFIEALHLFDRDWKKIEAFVGSKTVIQIRSHAQKYFKKVQKNGTSEHVPPPRPKRKAAHPYPQKAPKKAALLGSKYVLGPQSMSVPRNLTSSAPICSWAYSGAPMGCVSPILKDDSALSGGIMTHNWSSNSFEIAHCPWTSSLTNGQVNENQKEMRAVPDFAQVYSFIGSLFDPRARDHLKRLKMMDPINVETILMLVENLSVNLASAEFENHRRLLSSHNADIENDSMCSETSA